MVEIRMMSRQARGADGFGILVKRGERGTYLGRRFKEENTPERRFPVTSTGNGNIKPPISILTLFRGHSNKKWERGCGQSPLSV